MTFQPNFNLLKELCETPGVSGHEGPMRALVARHLREWCDDVRTDAMGNVIGTAPGNGGPRVMLAAHMDEIGFVVSHIDDKGFLRLQPIGGWTPRVMVAQRVYVHGYAGQRLLGALQPVNKLAPSPANMLTAQTTSTDEFFVDVGLSHDEVTALVELGDSVTMARTTERVWHHVLSKTLDDRVGVFMLLESLRRLRELGEPACEIVAVATVQEEVGLRGARTAAHHLAPDMGIALDVTMAADHPDSAPRDFVTELGKGIALKVKDGYSISDPRLVRHFRDVAEAHQIPYQLEVLNYAGSDAAAIQLSGGGVPVITLSLPVRYVHTPNETAAWHDIERGIELLARYLLEARTLAPFEGYSQTVYSRCGKTTESTESTKSVLTAMTPRTDFVLSFLNVCHYFHSSFAYH